MTIALIVAMDNNRLIGRNNQLPWHLPEDLRFFKQQTLGKPIIMGRKTYESIGKPLPGRVNIILTRNLDYRPVNANEQVKVVHSIDGAILASQAEETEICVIGGSEIYQLALPMADRLYITEVDAEFEGDAWFPVIDADHWKATHFRDASPEALEMTPEAIRGYRFVTYEHTP